jgi:hypothetical protein
MRAKDQCPSCFQPIAAGDFLCPHCELILDPSKAPPRPVGDISVVRRMLEAPQRGVPQARPETKGLRGVVRKGQGGEGPTKVLNLGPELAGVPVVVATLTKKAEPLTELEAWIVSLIDGLHDAEALAKKANLREFELRVVLRTLQEKKVIDFADEPLSDADLGLPSVVGTLEDEVPSEPITVPNAVAAAAPGASADRRDGRFVAPSSKPRPSALEVEAPIVTGRAEAPVLEPAKGPSKPISRHDAMPPYPSRLPTAPPVVTPAGRKPEAAAPRREVSAPAAKPLLQPARAKKPAQNFDDVLARDTLQVALRMEQQGRFEDAIGFLERSIAQSPDAASLYNRLGIIVMRERVDYERAEELMRKAVELAPGNRVYETNLQMVVSQQELHSGR